MAKTIRIAVTGGRDYTDRAKAYEVMDKALIALKYRLFVIVGCCPTGLDLFIREWCDDHKDEMNHVVVKADWNRYGKRAGPIRNSAMLDLHPDLLLSFPGGNGTKDCTDKAIAKGIKVRYIK